MGKLLEVQNLRVSFFTPSGELKAVNDVSYNLDAGEVIGIVGESGSGKSVSAYSVIGLIEKPGRIVGGSIRFNGRQLASLRSEQMRQIRGKEISMVFQDPMTSLNPVYTIGEQLMEAISLYSRVTREEARSRAVELLRLVDISEPERRIRQYPHEFSGGMRQRVMIAMALAGNPKLLIADEPTTALDVTIQAQILSTIKGLKDRIKMAVMLITHDLGIVADIADKVVVMYGGTIVEAAPCEEIFRHPQHPYTLGLLRSLPRLDAAEHEQLTPIAGTPIDLLNPPAGCPFASRCERCLKVCLTHKPPEHRLTEDHRVACWLFYDVAAGGVIR